MNANAFFKNIDTEDFEVFWNGKKRTFKAGEVKLLPAWFAEHCAKHLTNKLLLKSGDPMGERATSPKKPQDVPLFMETFKKCYQLQGTTAEAEKRDELDTAIELLNSGTDAENVNPEEKAPVEKLEEEFEDEKVEEKAPVTEPADENTKGEV